MITTETHTREHHCTFNPAELERIIAEAAAAKVQCDQPKIGRQGVTYTVRFEGVLGVGTQAVVVIVEDLMPQTAAAVEGE